MIKALADKEGAVEKLKNDLVAKQRKIEEDRAMQESRSDPESVTSSLTADTTRSDHSHHQNKKGEKKRKASSDPMVSSSGSDDKNSRMRFSEATTEDSSGEGRGGGSGSGSGSGTPNGSRKSTQGFSVGKTISTVSDMTDSNRGCCSNNSGSGGSSDDVQTKNHDPRKSAEDEGEGQRSASSISSDAAVASEKMSRNQHSGHKDVVFNNDKRAGRKRPPEEVTSLERSFELNYEEVFDKSNIPQLIATSSGKIITWNECFVKATGYRKAEIERMTIFSLVRPDKLSNFFEIVASALRPNEGGAKEGTDDKDASFEAQASTDDETNTCIARSDENDDATTKSEYDESGADQLCMDQEKSEVLLDTESRIVPKRAVDYAAMTLPCVNFPAMKKRNRALGESDRIIDPLHITVSFRCIVSESIFSEIHSSSCFATPFLT
jgi:hypothetical protein